MKLKREIIVLFLLLALITASLFNIAYISKLSESICLQIDFAEYYASRDDYSSALYCFDKAFSDFDRNKLYQGIFLRHSEVDSSYDCFSELKAELLRKEADAIPALCEKLKYHINCLADMEKLKLSSIL